MELFGFANKMGRRLLRSVLIARNRFLFVLFDPPWLRSKTLSEYARVSFYSYFTSNKR